MITTFPKTIRFKSDCTEIALEKINPKSKDGNETAMYRYVKAEVLINKELVLSLKQINKLISDTLIEVE